MGAVRRVTWTRTELRVQVAHRPALCGIRGGRGVGLRANGECPRLRGGGEWFGDRGAEKRTGRAGLGVGGQGRNHWLRNVPGVDQEGAGYLADLEALGG